MVWIPRGGELPNEDDEDAISSDDDTQNDTTSAVSAAKSRRRSPLASPFYMNEVARYEASVMSRDEVDSDVTQEDEPEEKTLQEEESEDETTNDNPKRRRDESSSSTRQERDDERSSRSEIQDGDRRKHKKKRRKRPSNRDIDQSEAVPQDETLASTGAEQSNSAETPDPDLPDTRDNKAAKEEASSSKNNDAANLWWVNMWTQQLMADDDDEEEVRQSLESQSSSDENEEIQAVEAELVLESSSDESDSVIEESDAKEEVTVVVDTLTPTYPGENFTEKVIHTDIIPEESTLNETTLDLDITTTVSETTEPSYVSSGIWGPVDNLLTMGLASRYSSLRVSKNLRPLRKWTAHVTGLHGVLSGKPSSSAESTTLDSTALDKPSNKDLQGIQRRIAAIDRARKNVDKTRSIDEKRMRRRRGLFGGLFGGRRNATTIETTKNATLVKDEENANAAGVPQKTLEEIEEERQRTERVKEIDRLISEGQELLQNLICEKDVLQRRPNPLFEYTTVKSTKKKVIPDETTNTSSNKTVEETVVQETIEVQATRKMNFPPDDLVAEYLDMMISTRRLIKMNHTFLWQESEVSEDEEETIGDDLFTASANAHRLYQDGGRTRRNAKEDDNTKTGGNGKSNNGGGGSWLLRQSLGGGPSLGEKIGEAAETAAYKAVCAALMSFLAKLLSSLHGINVLKHSDIRLVLEQAPDLPFMSAEGILPGKDGNYAEETLKTVMRQQKSKKRRKASKHRPSDDSFVQRDAVTEMLLSHVQISAPLLKLFPLAWQRALLGNIITLATAVISDFLDGLRFQILGHELSFAFRPITEEDMIRHFQIMSGGRLNHRKYKAAEFEAAVRATAEDVSEELKFLDRWHERALGSGVLRTQIANLIARIVLTLTDEILSAARIDLWSAQAGGPRMLAGLEYRMESIDIEEESV